MASSRSTSPASRRSRSVSPTTATTRLIAQSRNPFAALSDSSSEEDTDILRPRGKLAARMQVRGSEPQESESEVELERDASPTRTSLPTKDSVDAGSVAGQSDGNDEDDVVVTTRPRKLKSRRERSSTPETRPHDAASSPGLFISPQKDAPKSPGLFVSPSKPQSPSAGQSDSDLPSPMALTKNPRYKALLAKKRQQRVAREAEEARKKAEEARKKAERRQAAGHSEDDVMDEDEEDDNITDDEGGRKLTQEAATARPPRKASKRAMEEMNRETQRLTRSLQLAHEAKVKKKITKASLFERFNFKPEAAAAAPVEPAAPAASSSRAATPGSVQQSDAEMKDVETPPSSPPAAAKDGKSEEVAAPAGAGAINLDDDDEDDFPTLEELVAAAARKKLDKGKGKATAADPEEQPQPTEPPRKRNIRVILPPLQANTATLSLDDDDDDLQVEPTRKSKLDAIFDRIPLNQSKAPRALQLLRKLAHLDDPDKKATAPSRRGHKLQKQHQEQTMTVGQLQSSLWQRAREQAKLERDRHLDMLKAKGIHVQTAEEREREMQDVENIVAKAKKEAEEIMDREREAAKAERKTRRDAGEEDPLGWDDSDDDEEYQEEVEEEEVVEEGVEADIELSGSDSELDEDDEEVDLAEGMIDDAAEVSETEHPEEKVGGEDSDEELPNSNQVRRRPRKHVTIVTDDEDDAEPLVKATPRPKAHFAKSPSVPNAESPNVPTSVLRSARKTFIPGLPVAGPAGLGLTQIFAGTMDDSQMGTAASPSQPRPTFDVTAFPDSNFSQTAQEAAEDMILDSQPTRETQQAETQGVQLRFSQSQMHGFDTFLEENQIPPTQASQLIEPTQDAGFHNFSPLRQRFVEPPVSTVDTVPVGRTQVEEQNESPLVRRTGKLRRRAEVVPTSPSRRPASGEEDEVMTAEVEADEFGFGTVSNNAFAAMKDAALKDKKRKEAFDKKKSKAREMVQEQAEESEDEYAGLGGADGEGSDDDDDQSVKEMIDDETQNEAGDERKLAAFYADRERAADEKQVDKLFHDITTGMLRRKRTGNWDELSDSDDGGEARRRQKRRQFAKMQRALLADERISKVAENPRNQAFLRTIEDRGSDDEMDFIFAPPPPPPAGLERQDSLASTTGQAAVIPNSQPQTAPAPNPRRTKEGKKPSNIGEIRESLSNLLDEPYHASSSFIPATELGSSGDEADEQEDADSRRQSSHSASSNKENRNPRRSGKPNTAIIIDRINLKRNASSASTSTSNKLAFTSATTTTTTSTTLTAGGGGGGTGRAAGSSGSGSGTFRVPALLRRATTNSLLSTSSSSTSSSTGVTTSTSTGGSNSNSSNTMKIKKTAGKRSGVSYLARETERRAAVAEAERRREARKWRGAEGRVKAVGGLFGGGKFE
ncbi:MRC1-like domain-containing protein [Chaetomidium leptoderma]|uniref:MRC1-like domain-containing protein n=1 Tax=Chaetomidium leptoderma TaxID=669021 RepID=A0AAN6VVH8_9PEZI|nr:MRC1-like domain-containing protein [Chaetomidium leptoderma]